MALPPSAGRDAVSELRQEIAALRGELNLLRWMVGANFALTLAVFVKVFVH